MQRRGCIVLIVLALARAASADPAYDSWAAKYPAAAKELAAFVPKTPGGAKDLGDWATANPADFKKVGEYLKAHEGAEFETAAEELKMKKLTYALVGGSMGFGLFTQALARWAKHNPDAMLALFSDVAAAKAAFTAPKGSKGDLVGALEAAAPALRDSDEKYVTYSTLPAKEVPGKGKLNAQFGAEYHDAAVAEWADMPGYEVLQAYIAAYAWVESIDSSNNLPHDRLLKGVTIIRKDKTKCMILFDGLTQDWTHRDSSGRDYWTGSRYTANDWLAPRKLDCPGAKPAKVKAKAKGR